MKIAYSTDMNTKEIQLLILSGSILFLKQADTSFLSTLIVKIAKDFHVSEASMSSSILWYIIGSCIFIPAVAWISKTWSKINVVLITIILFLFSSLVCGMSENVVLFTFSRFIQGISASVAYSVSTIMLIENSSKKNIVMSIGLSNLPAMIGISSGPVIGALFTHYISWRYAFYFNIPLCLLLMVFIYFFIKDKVSQSVTENYTKFDFYGFVTLSFALMLISVGIESFNKAHITTFIYCLSTGAICLLLHFILYKFKDKNNILKLSVFSDPNFFIGTLINITSRIGMTGISIILSIYLQKYLHLSILKVGMLIAIIFLFGAIAKFFSSLLLKIGLYNSLVLAILLTSISFLLMENITSLHLYWFYWIILSFLGFSMSLLYTVMNSMMLITIEHREISDACNIQAIIQQMFTGIGIVFSMALLFYINQITLDLQLSFIYVCRISAAIISSGLIIVFFVKLKGYRLIKKQH